VLKRILPPEIWNPGFEADVSEGLEGAVKACSARWLMAVNRKKRQTPSKILRAPAAKK
jgi:hypothetical protein